MKFKILIKFLYNLKQFGFHVHKNKHNFFDQVFIFIGLLNNKNIIPLYIFYFNQKTHIRCNLNR